MRGRLRPAERIQRLGRQCVRLLNRVIHQVASDGTACIRRVGAQEDHRVLDAIRGKYNNFAGHEVLWFIQWHALADVLLPFPTLVVNTGNPLSALIELQTCYDSLSAEHCTCREGLLDMKYGFVSGLDRTEGHA